MSEPAGSTDTEHFVTLFDSVFLPIGLALHRSLAEHGEPFHLWVICMDEAVCRDLKRLALRGLTPIPLAEVENDRLLGVKPRRSLGEYCWTMTPFSFEAALARAPEAARVTYVDADVFFLADPRALLAELDESRKHVLITEHAYAPGYDQTALSGRFCVQFLTADRSDAAGRVLHWWQDRCIECCSAQPINGKFGDQMYLDQWPELFADAVHVVRQTDKALAPWNVRHFEALGRTDPVLYHFHGLRLLPDRKARLYCGYRVGSFGARLYRRYLGTLTEILAELSARGIVPPPMRLPAEPIEWLHRIKRSLDGTEKRARLP